MSLFLKYRPQLFDEMQEQTHIIDIIISQIQSKDLNANYLFYGARGTWKTTTARLLARAANCLTPVNGNPCNECANCKSIIEWKSLDFVEIDAASHTQVDNIREEIIEKAPYPPTQLLKKVYIIDEVHMLSKAAFNALLKIMEEPPVYLMFILATTEINKVPETIISRCQVFNFRKLTIKAIVSRLEFICQQERFKYEIPALELIAKASDGALRDAIKYLDQLSVLDAVNVAWVIRFLWIAPTSVVENFLATVKTYEVDTIFKKIEELSDSGLDMNNFIKDVLYYIDQHLLEEPAFYVSLTNVLQNIFKESRNHPFPVLLYKTYFYDFIQWWGTWLPISEPVQKKTASVVKPEPIKEIIIESPKDTIVEEKAVIVEATVPTEPVAIVEIPQEPEVSVVSQVEDSVSYDLDELMQKMIEYSDRKSIKMILEQSAHIQSVKGGIVTLAIINQIQFKTISKEENSVYLQEVLSQNISQDLKLHIVFQAKEDFLKEQLLF